MKVYVLEVYHTDGYESTEWVHGIYSKEPKAKRHGERFLKDNPDDEFDRYGYSINEYEVDE